MGQTARRAFVATLVAAAVIACALALWQLRALFALFLLGLVIAAAMRPGVEALRRKGVPSGAGIALHYLALLGLIALILWLVVPRAIDQLSAATGGNLPSSSPSPRRPTGSTSATARRLVVSLVPRRNRRVVHDTWELIDLKLGAFVRGQLLLVLFVATLLSLAFWAVGEPYWLLIGIFAGVVELLPIVGPIAAGVVAIGAGFSIGWHVALLAGLAVFAVRMLEDYVVVPKVLGHAVGLSPLVVLVAVTALGLLLGGLYVLLAIPLAAILGTLVDVAVRDKDPAEEEVPTVIFPAQDRETVGG